MSSVIADAQQRIRYSRNRGQETQLLWQTSLTTAIEEPEFVNANAAELASLVVEAARTYDSRILKRAVLRFASVAAKKNETFVKALAAAVVKQSAGAGTPGKFSRGELYALLGLSRVAVQRLDTENAKKAIAKLVEVQGQLADALTNLDLKWKVVSRQLSGEAKAQPSIKGDMLELAKAPPANVSAGCPHTVAHALLDLATAKPQAHAEVMQDVLTVFCDKVINGRERVTPAMAACYAELFKSLTQEDFSSKVMPAVTRSLRRTSDVAMTALSALLAGASLDVSPQAQELTTILIQQLRTKESVRGLAISTLQILASRIQDAASLTAAAGVVKGLLDGSTEGKIKAVAERLALSQAFLALAGSPARGADAADLGDSMAAFAVQAAKEEANDEARGVLLSGAAAWLAMADGTGQGITQVVTILSGFVKEGKEVPRRQALKAATQALAGNNKLRAAFAPFVEPAVKVVTDALAKPALRLDGIMALHAAVNVAAAVSDADALLESSKVWSNVFKLDSSLLGLSVVSKLSAADIPPLVQLAELLLTSHTGRLLSLQGGQDLVCRLLAGLSLHADREVRKSAKAALGRVPDAPGLLRPLTTALIACADNPSSVTALAIPQDASAEDAVLQPGTLAARLAAAVRALLPSPRDKPCTADELCALAIICHHSTMTRPLPGKTVASVWTHVTKRLPGLTKAVTGMATQLIEQLQGPDGITSTSESRVSAAQAALGAITALAPTSMLQHVTGLLASLLDRSAHDQLKRDELFIWSTPRGILSTERPQEGVYIGQIVESKNVRKARGRFKSGDRAFADEDDDDDMPAQAMRRPALTAPPAHLASNGAAAAGGRAAAPGKKDAAARQAEWRQAKLAEEEQVRQRVDGINARLDLGAATMTAVVTRCPRAVGSKLGDLQALIMPLLASPVSGDSAFRAAEALATCLPAPINAHALSVAASLRLVILSQRMGSNVNATDIPHASQVADVIHALRKVTSNGRPLFGPAYRFVFPIVEAVLSSPEYTPLHDEALALVSLHCRVGLDVPRPATNDMLHHLLGVIPAYRDRVAPLLKQLASGCISEEEVVSAARGVLHAAAPVRAAALAALQEVPALAQPGTGAANSITLTCLLWVACHDVNEDNAKTAKQIWEQAGFSIPKDYVQELIGHVTQCPPEVQAAAGAAMSSAATAHPDTVKEALDAVVAAYADGDVSERRGCAVALRCLAPNLGDKEVTAALDFLIGNGLADMNEKVREEMVTAGTAIVDAHGSRNAPLMLPVFEHYLDDSKRGSAAANGHGEAAYDLVREGVVVFMGTLARHLPADDPKRASVVDVLVSVLSTPSQPVQRSVSNCLSPLMGPLANTNKEAIDALVARLLDTLRKGKTYGERRGAAYGLAGVVKGLGIMSMKNAGIMDALKAAVEDKKDAGAREGALLAFECLSEKLGKLFEPYIIYILPLLLQCFGDGVPQVRAATEDASRMIMGQLTASGVKLVLPALLKGLEDKVWRTKQGSVQLLGSMAYCAPKQLGTCLPQIVPRLSDVLSDPHPKVQAAANEALKEIGSVIRNPEVSTLVPSLMQAIADPNGATRPALSLLLETVFVNTIDAASLALIVPVIHRGLRDRTGDTKKRAARIAGNMASLVNDPKDMVPYVPLLRPELQKALVDPLPEVRAMAARAIGSLLQGMGTEQFGDLIPWLMTTLKSDASSVERSGAAQGLAEVLAVLGPNHLDALLPDLLAGCADRSSPAVREGHLVLLQYLPVTLEATFQAYLGRVLPAVLDGLADESEGVRDAALGAGRILVDHYANSALHLLLPAVENGIFEDNWRIRQSSVKLLGKLLFKVAGTSGNVVVDGGSDDEGAAEDSYNEAIIQALGMDRRNEVLARLYISRSDPQYPVRTEALHVWKSVVPNTPKTLGQLLPTLMSLIIESLADAAEDRQIMAGRCLGELVRKMGERVLGRIIPILVEGVHAPAVSTRQGVCLGMKEVLENIGRQQMAECLADVLPAIQAALIDEDPAVREAAGGAFSILFRGGAGSAVDSVVPSMLEGLAVPAKYGESVEGLRVILGVRPQMLNSVLPKLTKQPLQLHALKALKQLAGVASPMLHHHVKALVPPLLLLANKAEGDREAAAREALSAIATSMPEDGVHLLVQELCKGLEDSSRRRAAATLITSYAQARKNSPDQLLEYVPQMLNALISLFADDDSEVVLACWKAVEAVTALIPKEEAAEYVRCVKEAVATAKETERRKRTGKALLVAGLCLPKALSPILPIYLQSVLQGSSTEMREAGAEGLGELVAVTSEEALKPYVVQITGPLIRIIGDRFPSQIKAAILVTLGALITKAGVGLKPFVPQLQTTFLKCLADQADTVRQHAALNLGELSRMSPRVEQLATELATSARTADATVRESYLAALRGLLANSGDRLGPAVSASLGDSLRDIARLAADDDAIRYSLASCLGAHAKHAPLDQVKTTLQWGPFSTTASAADRPLHACVLATVAGSAAGRLQEAGLLQPAMDAATKFARDSQIPFKVAAGRAAARLAAANTSILPAACNVLAALMGPDQNSEVQRQAMLAVRRMSTTLVAAAGPDAPNPLEAQLPLLIPPMCAIAAGTSGPIKVTCELSLARVLQLEGGASEIAQKYLASGPGTTVKSVLTDPFMRRIAKISEDDELFTQEEY